MSCCCDRPLGEADPVAQSAAATVAVDHSKTHSPKINRRRRGPQRGADSPRRSASPRARARVRENRQRAPFSHADLMRSRAVAIGPVAGAKKRSASTSEGHVVLLRSPAWRS